MFTQWGSKAISAGSNVDVYNVAKLTNLCSAMTDCYWNIGQLDYLMVITVFNTTNTAKEQNNKTLLNSSS